jgi:1-acyl-sn-glycerol-3-phosphate acyltransferase
VTVPTDPGPGFPADPRRPQSERPADSERPDPRPGLPVAARVVIDRLRRPGEHAGATRPEGRLAVTPAAVRAIVGRRPRPRLPGGFPLSAPTWPTTVPRPPLEFDLGVDYDSDWARRTPARVVRLLLNEGITRPVVKALAAPDVTGLDRIAHLHGSAIFAANHASHVDTPLLISVIPEPWRHRLVVAGAADYFFDTRIKASVFALTLNAVPIERQRTDRTSVNRLAALLEDGWSLLLYPEGGRSPDGWGQAHTAGAGWLAARTGRPVVPIHVEGTRRVLPRHGKRLRPGRTQVSFGRPLRAGPKEGRVLAGRIEAAVAALADEGATDWWTATRRAATATTPALTGPGAASAWRRTWTRGEGRRRPPAEERWPRD